MTKPLEPTEEQLRAIAEVINKASADPWSQGPLAGETWPSMARAAWDLIASMVLEAAEKEFEARHSPGPPGTTFYSPWRDAAHVIRAMKGRHERAHR